MKNSVVFMSVLACLCQAYGDTGASGTESIVGGGGKKLIHYRVEKLLTRHIIDQSVLRKLSMMKSDEKLQVLVLLNNIDEETQINAQASGFLNQNNTLEQIKVTASSAKMRKQLARMQPREKLEQLQELHLEKIDSANKKREDKAREILQRLPLQNIKDIGRFDAQSGVLKVSLTKKQILETARHTQDIINITIAQKKSPGLASAFDHLHLNTTWWSVSTYGGQGIGIYMNESEYQNSGASPCFEENSVEPVVNFTGLGGGSYTEDRDNTSNHANEVAQSLRIASPRSHIYCSDEVYSVPSAWENDIHIVNYSWWYINNNRNWQDSDTYTDRFVYNSNIETFTIAGNGCDSSSSQYTECVVSSPGKSHNVVTVGTYNDETNRMGAFSNWKNPNTGAMKPEILAPGVSLNFAANLGFDSGTSFASPLAAGLAASNMSVMGDGMKKHAALIKASVLAMAVKNNITASGDSRPDGANGLQWNPAGWYSWYEWSNSALNDADGAWKLIGTYNLQGYQQVKIALSWLNREEVCDGHAGGSSYSAEPSHLCMDLAMKVENPNGSIVVWKDTPNQNWEADEFYTNVGGDYKVYVWRTRNRWEWTRKYYWQHKKYHYNDVKMGLRIAYIQNRNN